LDDNQKTQQEIVEFKFKGFNDKDENVDLDMASRKKRQRFCRRRASARNKMGLSQRKKKKKLQNCLTK
jgi:hypothetical protein